MQVCMDLGPHGNSLGETCYHSLCRSLSCSPPPSDHCALPPPPPPPAPAPPDGCVRHQVVGAALLGGAVLLARGAPGGPHPPHLQPVPGGRAAGRVAQGPPQAPRGVQLRPRRQPGQRQPQTPPPPPYQISSSLQPLLLPPTMPSILFHFHLPLNYPPPSIPLTPFLQPPTYSLQPPHPLSPASHPHIFR